MLYNCLSWYKFVYTHLYHSRQLYNIHISLLLVCDNQLHSVGRERVRVLVRLRAAALCQRLCQRRGCHSPVGHMLPDSMFSPTRRQTANRQRTPPACQSSNNVDLVVGKLGLVAWHSGRTSVSGRGTFPVLRSTCSSRWLTTIVGKPFATGQPTRPTQHFILLG